MHLESNKFLIFLNFLLLLLNFEFESADNGGGMHPEKMRQCMSLGYSAKSKIANTIGQCKSAVSLAEACPF